MRRTANVLFLVIHEDRGRKFAFSADVELEELCFQLEVLRPGGLPNSGVFTGLEP